jgi:hypothetical protein
MWQRLGQLQRQSSSLPQDGSEDVMEVLMFGAPTAAART